MLKEQSGQSKDKHILMRDNQGKDQDITIRYGDYIKLRDGEDLSQTILHMIIMKEVSEFEEGDKKKFVVLDPSVWLKCEIIAETNGETMSNASDLYRALKPYQSVLWSTEFVLMPVTSHNHHTLFVIHNAGNIIKQSNDVNAADSDEGKICDADPHILGMDSLNNVNSVNLINEVTKGAFARDIRKGLNVFLEFDKLSAEQKKEARKDYSLITYDCQFNAKNLPFFLADSPPQPGGNDCGLCIGLFVRNLKWRLKLYGRPYGKGKDARFDKGYDEKAVKAYRKEMVMMIDRKHEDEWNDKLQMKSSSDTNKNEKGGSKKRKRSELQNDDATEPQRKKLKSATK